MKVKETNPICYYTKAMMAVFTENGNVSQFVNFGTRRPLEIQQYTEFTSKSSTCKWSGSVSLLDYGESFHKTN